MNDFKVFEIKKSVYESNDAEAVKLRNRLKDDNVFMINIMSSPGSGKTTMLEALIPELQKSLRVGVMEADLDSDVDAKTIHKTGAKVCQLHTGGMCHLDADMTRQGLDILGTDDVDLVFLENIGNLICTAEYDVGANINLVILSVPEGDDKPLKYPTMFENGDILIVSKIDTMSVFDFDMNKLSKRIKELNPNMKIFPISAKKGDGIKDVCEYILEQIKTNK